MGFSTNSSAAEAADDGRWKNTSFSMTASTTTTALVPEWWLLGSVLFVVVVISWEGDTDAVADDGGGPEKADWRLANERDPRRSKWLVLESDGTAYNKFV